MNLGLLPLLLLLVGAAGGCIDEPAPQEPVPPVILPPHEAPLPALVLEGCENHNAFLQVPEPAARPLVPEEFTLFTLGIAVQAEVSFLFCEDLLLENGTSLGPANWLYLHVRLAEVDPALSPGDITFYLVMGYTDNPLLAALHQRAGLPMEEASFSITRLPGRWSFVVDVVGAQGQLLSSTQASEQAAVFDSDEPQAYRALHGSGGSYAWAQQNYTQARGYIATHTVVPFSGPAADLLAAAPNGAFAVPGTVSDGTIGFGATDISIASAD